MSYILNNQQKVNEIIFAKRNKAYGAYVIRSNYGNTVFKSLSIMLTGCGLIISFAFYLNNKNRPQLQDSFLIKQDSVIVTTFQPMKEEVQPQEKQEAVTKKPEAPAKTDTEHSTTIVDSVKTEAIVNVDPTVKSTSTSTSTGVDGPVVTGGGGGEGKKTGEDIDLGEKINEGYGVDSNAEFAGGLTALYKFVSSHLKYPAVASQLGEEGTVYVKFVVDEKGKVGNLILQNNAGFGFDEEAVRVVSMLPDFKTPAKIKGKPVKVYYQLPIKFKYRT